MKMNSIVQRFVEDSWDISGPVKDPHHFNGVGGFKIENQIFEARNRKFSETFESHCP